MSIYSSQGGGIAGDLSRSPSGSLWHQVDADGQRSGIWREYWNGFDGQEGADGTALPTSPAIYRGGIVFTDTGGTFTHVMTSGEEGDLIVSSDAADEGASFTQGSEPFAIIQDAGELIFEARFKVSTIANDGLNTFAGLIEAITQSATVPIVAGPTEAVPLSDNNLVGFSQNEVDGDQLNTVYKANGITLVTVKADAQTLVADTYIKPGMVFNRNGDNYLRFYINGVELPDKKFIPSAAGTDFPNDVQLGVVYAVLNDTTIGNTHFSWIRCAQKRNW